MKLSEELRKRLELAEAHERGERVEVLGRGVWWPADRYNIKANCLSTIRIAPRTIRIGDRDLALPMEELECAFQHYEDSARSGLIFASVEDRRAFDEAVMALVGREGK